jgi:hypothetical protein
MSRKLKEKTSGQTAQLLDGFEAPGRLDDEEAAHAGDDPAAYKQPAWLSV